MHTSQSEIRIKDYTYMVIHIESCQELKAHVYALSNYLSEIWAICTYMRKSGVVGMHVYR